MNITVVDVIRYVTLKGAPVAGLAMAALQNGWDGQVVVMNELLNKGDELYEAIKVEKYRWRHQRRHKIKEGNMNWRPEGWENPHTGFYPTSETFEEGADAMLEALKTLGQHYDDIEAPYRTIGVLKEIKEPGTLVFIPDNDAT